MSTRRKVVVTGGAGFIGAHVCRHLADELGHEVVAYDDLSTGAVENLQGIDGARLVEADVLDADALDAAFEGAASVVHLAARPSVPRSLQDPMASHRVNATGTLAVLESLRRTGVPHVVIASSSSVYGASPTMPRCEDHATAPLSPYAASKLATEAYARAYAHSFDVRALVFRFFNVFGPLQPAGHAYAAVVPSFLSGALEERPVEVFGDGEQTRDFTYVGTVADVISRAVDRGVTHDGPVNLAYGTRTSLNQLLDLLEELLGRPVERMHRAPRRGDVRDSQADDRLVRAMFPEVRPMPLADALAETLAWFRGQQSVTQVA